jgi:hypothetical protein
MSKSLSFGDAIVATAKHKRDAAQARSSPIDAEKPRDVILRACEIMADQLKEDGFVFVKSGPKLKRDHGDHVFSMLFQSDRNNIAARRAAVWMHAGVQNKGSAEFIDGGQIGNSVPQKT